MWSEVGRNSTVHLADLDEPFLSWVTDSSSSSAVRYLSWEDLRRTALALWKRSIAVVLGCFGVAGLKLVLKDI